MAAEQQRQHVETQMQEEKQTEKQFKVFNDFYFLKISKSFFEELSRILRLKKILISY